METRQRIELQFDCATTGGEYRRIERWRGPSLVVDEYQGRTPKTIPQSVEIQPDILGLLCNVSGTVLIRQESGSRWIVSPPRSVVFVRGPIRLAATVARGAHQAYLVTWPGWSTPLLNTWLNQRLQAASVQRQRILSAKPIDPFLSEAFRRLETVLNGPEDSIEPLVLSVLYEMVPSMMVGPNTMQLAPLPPDLPVSIRSLVESVMQRPDAPWPLKDASAAAGYSPFHFSRVFKGLAGFGFHEFVDRCRTEFAVGKLCEGDLPVDLVASTSGFGTTQGLRESIKEYLGLVPSELRVSSDG